jgi:hypothetical protein
MKQITQTLAERRQLKGPGTMFKNSDIYSAGDLSYLEPEGENISGETEPGGSGGKSLSVRKEILPPKGKEERSGSPPQARLLR